MNKSQCDHLSYGCTMHEHIIDHPATMFMGVKDPGACVEDPGACSHRVYMVCQIALEN
jgi:hypothetical protein